MIGWMLYWGMGMLHIFTCCCGDFFYANLGLFWGIRNVERLFFDIEYNLDEILGLDPKKDAYVNEEEFLKDLRFINVS
jgi:hypothetical protein